MAIVTGLAVNEIFCLAQKRFNPGNTIIGNCVNTLGLNDKLESNLSGMFGQELKPITKILSNGRQDAFLRMMEEAISLQNNAVISVTNKLIFHGANLEFLASGYLIHSYDLNLKNIFSSNSNGKQFYCQLDTGYTPISWVFGNIAYSTVITGGLVGKLKAFSRGEVTKLSDIFTRTRRLTLERIILQAKTNKANSVINIKVETLFFKGINEMLLTGTSAHHPLFNEFVTSTLTADETWSLAKLGYAPKSILLSSFIFSLGFMDSITSTIKLLYLKEIPGLTKMVNEARKKVLEDINREAEAINAKEVIDIKTYVYHLGNGLIEFFAIGTAINKLPEIKTLSEQLPFQVLNNS